MEQIPSVQFLAGLPVFAEFENVADLTRYQPLPPGWTMAVADIVSSGTAIAAGRYKMVNMAGAAVISAVLNSLGQTDFPFAFGGDGAAVAVPPEGVDAARAALAAVSRWILEELQLEMRAALVPVEDIRAAGLDVQVALHQASPNMSFAMFAGGGTAWAEAQMKNGRFAVDMAAPGTVPDLTGLSCRWDPVKARNGQIVSIIAVPGAGGPTPAFRTLVGAVVAEASAAEGTGHPLPQEGPRPRVYLGGIDAEAAAQARPGKRLLVKIGVVIAILLTVVMHRLNLTIGGFNARQYTKDVASNSDFRKFDDGLKMTIDIDSAGYARIKALLQAAAADGICQYGLHSQDEALVTCIVMTPLSRNHMHFVDGAAGGYALAASRMKADAAARSVQAATDAP